MTGEASRRQGGLAGYANAGALSAARRDHSIGLHGPLKAVTVPHARGDAAFGQNAFTIDWDNQYVTCPNGAVSTQWAEHPSKEGLPEVRVRFSPADCGTCPQLPECVNSPRLNAVQLGRWLGCQGLSVTMVMLTAPVCASTSSTISNGTMGSAIGAWATSTTV
ncbi:hypothetical protein [Streptomyces sp. CB03238]|uniref:hypothetical protein n=1 Tax=Streptomyces sp. CB03238 TaxID=1907777 RepID=UPI0015C4A571|nr:hypothetical protein [Streptomyces sp. CB03238]